MKFEGIIPALLTPFDADDELDTKAIDPLVNRLLEQGIGGLFVCGATGEWWALTSGERMALVDHVMAAVAGRTKVIVHVGSTSTRFAVELAEHAARAGAAAVSTLPPAGASHSAEAIWGYFRAIGDATDLPLYLYHFPRVYGDAITIDHFVEALDTMPTLRGVKFSSYDVDTLIDLRTRTDGRLNILSGAMEQLLSGIACGAEGSICTWYNFIPRLGNKIIECVRSGDFQGARRHEDLAVRFAKISSPKALGFLKWLVAMRGIKVGRPRLPVPDSTTAERDQLRPRIEALGIFDWCI